MSGVTYQMDQDRSLQAGCPSHLAVHNTMWYRAMTVLRYEWKMERKQTYPVILPDMKSITQIAESVGS